MRLLKNRIVLALVVVVVLTYLWEFYGKPVTGPIYVNAVKEYEAHNYTGSLEVLQNAYRIDPNNTDILTLFGWNYLKLGRVNEAKPYFERALRLNPDLADATLGLAHCWVELGDAQRALTLFNKLSESERKSTDVRIAMARAYRMQGDNRPALELLQAVLREDPEQKLAKRELALLTGTDNPDLVSALPAATPRPATLTLGARVREGYFEVRQGERWQRVFVAGIDLRPTVAGHFATEPPIDMSTYLQWLNQMGGMGANSVRAYTLLPPAFYRALLTYNSQNKNKPIYLFQGVWSADPPNSNLLDQKFTAEFDRELREVVDAIHGQASLPLHAGHSGGVYAADVSPYVLGWLVGREIEPHIAIATNQHNPEVKSFSGRYVQIEGGNAAEVWFAQKCEAILNYEVEKHNWQRPVAFVNGPALDPLTHPTESGLEEEYRIRMRYGERTLPPVPPVVDDDDAVSLDPMKLKATSALAAGLFAAYSVYPYYPDFMNLDPRYLKGRDARGPSSFAAYLEDLRRYHQGMALLVAEFGLSTSLGVAHTNPLGWNHGGHSEVEQGEYLARMITTIADKGCAGGLIQGWVDEWYRQSWLVRDFVNPGARSRLWLNVLSPDANQGLIGYKTSHQDIYRLRGDASRWRDARPLYETRPDAPVMRSFGDPFDRARHLLRVYADSDEAYLYLRLDVESLDNDRDGRPDWKQANYMIALRTTATPMGSESLPLVSGARLPGGANYVIRLGAAADSKLLVASAYNPRESVPIPGLGEVTQLRYKIPFLPKLEAQGRFEEIVVEPNRRRYGRDGHFYPAVRQSLSPLKWGTLDQGSLEYSSLTEWYANPKTNIIELRIPWGLLGVTDPSSLQVLAGIDRSGSFYTETTKGIQVAVLSYRPQTGEVADALPRFGSPGVFAEKELRPYTWTGWDSVNLVPYQKDSYTILRRTLVGLRAPGESNKGASGLQKGRGKQ